MASSSEKSPKAFYDRVSENLITNPMLQIALPYTISVKEYETLHTCLSYRSESLRRSMPSIARVKKLVERPGRDDFNRAAMRAAIRALFASSAALKAWAVFSERFLRRDRPGGRRQALWRSSNFRLSFSISSIIFLHRILYRFCTRLRAHLLTPEAKPFRRRNKWTSQTLTSTLAPAVGASLAGFLLAVYPKDQFRLTLSIYALSRAVQISYNHAENQGWIWGKEGSRWERPWWWGSWLIFPLTCGQLLHAFVFDRDCFPKEYGDFILKNSPQYIQSRPVGFPPTHSWPSTHEIVDSLATMARLNYPPFISPILFPSTPTTLPKRLTQIESITSPAHPLITSLTCAILHPTDPSCLRTYLTYWLRVFPRLMRFFTVIFLLLSIPTYKSLYKSPIRALHRIAILILKYSTFTAGAIGTSWSAICLFQQVLPRHVLATQRFFLGGVLGGLWGWVVRRDATAEFVYSARLSALSMWKLGQKKRWWKGWNGGDVWLFVGSLMIMNLVYDTDGREIDSGVLRRVLSSLRGEGWRDWIADEKERLEVNER